MDLFNWQWACTDIHDLFSWLFLLFSLDDDGGPIVYDPSSATCISQYPHRPDPYEKIHVYVAPSQISKEAGEGLFAKKVIKKDQLVCLFNGIRRFKEGRVVRIGANDDGWSDYRITLGMSRKFSLSGTSYSYLPNERGGPFIHFGARVITVTQHTRYPCVVYFKSSFSCRTWSFTWELGQSNSKIGLTHT